MTPKVNEQNNRILIVLLRRRRRQILDKQNRTRRDENELALINIKLLKLGEKIKL